VAVFRRKRNAQEEKAPKKTAGPDKASANEEVYLEQLQQLMSSKTGPYIRRKQPSRDASFATGQPEANGGPPTPPQTSGPARNGQPSIETPDGRVRRGSDGVYHMTLDVPRSDLDQYEDDPMQAAAPPPPRPPESRPPPPPPPPRPKAPEPPPAPRHEDAPRQAGGLFEPGTLVLWGEGQLAIYKEHLEEKGYDVVYSVEPGGRLQPKGICLFAYEPQRLGLLADGILKWMEQRMRWERDALVYHLDNLADVEKIAVLNAQANGVANGNKLNGNNGRKNGELVRGQTFTVKMGAHQWHGVYWGRDSLGTIVAHNTLRKWTLMHLELKRFASSMEYDDILPDAQIEAIEKSLPEE